MHVTNQALVRVRSRFELKPISLILTKTGRTQCFFRAELTRPGGRHARIRGI